MDTKTKRRTPPGEPACHRYATRVALATGRRDDKMSLPCNCFVTIFFPVCAIMFSLPTEAVRGAPPRGERGDGVWPGGTGSRCRTAPTT